MPKQRRTKRTILFEEYKKKILSGEMKPGDLFPSAKTLGSSVMWVRERRQVSSASWDVSVCWVFHRDADRWCALHGKIRSGPVATNRLASSVPVLICFPSLSDATGWFNIFAKSSLKKILSPHGFRKTSRKRIWRIIRVLSLPEKYSKRPNRRCCKIADCRASGSRLSVRIRIQFMRSRILCAYFPEKP